MSIASNMKDLQASVTAVYEILSDVYPVSPWSEKQILSDMQQDNVDYFFVKKDEKLVGFLVHFTIGWRTRNYKYCH